MKKVFMIAIGLVSLFSFSSCYTLIFNSMGFLENSASQKMAKGETKQVIFIPMHHIGKKEFYADVEKKVDSLRRDGFVIYFEGVRFSKDNDSMRNDTLAMKLRKITGLDMRVIKSQGGYIDTINNSLMGTKIKAVSKHNLVNQPKQYILFDTLSDRRVDAYLSDAIFEFEKKFGTVPLNDCDYKTKPDARYKCDNFKKKEGKEFITIVYRNKFIADEIIKEHHSKIALVYGAKHFKGILNELQQHDSSWKAY